MMKEQLTAKTKPPESVTMYVLHMRQELDEMANVARKRLSRMPNTGMIAMLDTVSSQMRIKCWYCCQQDTTNYLHSGKDPTL